MYCRLFIKEDTSKTSEKSSQAKVLGVFVVSSPFFGVKVASLSPAAKPPAKLGSFAFKSASTAG